MPDHRSQRQKLEALASHPRTPPNEAAAARRALGRMRPEKAGPRPTVLSDEMLGKQPAGRQTGPTSYNYDNAEFADWLRRASEMLRRETEAANHQAAQAEWLRRYTSPTAQAERDAAREQARRFEEANHRYDPATICPGCTHRSELHTGDTCYQCGFDHKSCDWVYTRAEPLPGWPPQTRRPGWERNHE